MPNFLVYSPGIIMAGELFGFALPVFDVPGMRGFSAFD